MKRTQRYTPEKILNPFFIYTWIVAFTLQMGQNIYNATMTVYAGSLGLSNTFAGNLFIPYLVLAILGRVLSGFVSDTTSRRLAMVLGCGMFLLGSVFFNIPALAVLPFIMMLARGVHGFGYACASTAYSVAAVDVTPPDKIGIGVGLNWTAQGIAQAVGGVLMTVLVINGDYTLLFLAATGFLVAAEVFSILCGYEGPRPEKAQRQRPTLQSIASDLFEKSALPYALITLVFYLGLCACSLFALAAAESRGIPNGGLFYTACSVSMTLCNIFLVRLQARFGSLRVLLPSFLLMLLADLILAGCTSFGLYLLAGLFYGAALGIMPVMQNAMVRHLPVFRRGAGTSTLFLAMDLAMGFGPSIWGAVSDAAGFRTVYLLSAGCIACAIILMIIVFRAKERTGTDKT